MRADDPSGFVMWIGPDQAGNLVEVGVVEDDDTEYAIHAIPARRRYLELLGEDDCMATTTKHPKEMSEADAAALVERLDEAVDRGEARAVAGAVLVELRAAAAARRAAEERLESAVLAGRSAGLSWGVIGAQLGVTRQGARQRFERLVDS